MAEILRKRVSRGSVKRHDAFTLIESLIVVVILAILCLLILPSVALARKITKMRLSEARMAMLTSACNMYKYDFKDYPPSSDTAGDYFTAGTARGAYLFVLLLTGYAPDVGTLGAPAASGTPFSEDDGAADYGFRTSRRGQVYGPYCDVNKVPQYRATAASPPVFIDVFSSQGAANPILYYKMSDTDNDGINDSYIASDNYTGSAGDLDGPGPTDNDLNNYCKDGSGRFYRNDFMLMSRGGESTWIAPKNGSYNVTNREVQ